MNKNQATRIYVYAYNRVTGLPDNDNLTNISVFVNPDGSADNCIRIQDTIGLQLDGVSAPGMFSFALTAAETNYDYPFYSAICSASNIVCDVRFSPIQVSPSVVKPVSIVQRPITVRKT